MTLTIVTTPGAADANAYCTLAEAEAYVATLVWATDWSGKTDEQKKAAIINAARLLDTLSWKGARAAEAQSMAWPRIASAAADSPNLGGWVPNGSSLLKDRDGYEIPSTTVPTVVKNANAEFALRLFSEDRSADAGAIVPDRVKLGQLEVEKQRRQMVPASVMDMIGHLLKSSGGVIQGVRG